MSKGYIAPLPKLVELREQERLEIAVRGVSVDEVVARIEAARRSGGLVRLLRACEPADGITILLDERIDGLMRRCDQAIAAGRVTRLIPASGAASRMLDFVRRARGRAPTLRKTDLEFGAREGNEGCEQVLRFFRGLRGSLLYRPLEEALRARGLAIETLLAGGDFYAIVDAIIDARGLNYGAATKALMFLSYDGLRGRSAVEEHVIDTLSISEGASGRLRLHFTVRDGELDKVRRLIDQAVTEHCSPLLAVELSVQRRSSDTVAFTARGSLVRGATGEICLWPGGHGALLENLSNLSGDIVTIRNIDNVGSGNRRAASLYWERALVGYLVELQAWFGECCDQLTRSDNNRELCHSVSERLRNAFGIVVPPAVSSGGLVEYRLFLLATLLRPTRVCGVVRKSHGTCGGGPFWVEGVESPQFVEGVQIDQWSTEQRAIAESSRYMNPVCLACSLTDPLGRRIRLREFVDDEAVLIARRAASGQPRLVVEWPGLWNGGMARWNTIFVEMPAGTWRAVKSLVDLL